jgi:hypothetical protein
VAVSVACLVVCCRLRGRCLEIRTFPVQLFALFRFLPSDTLLSNVIGGKIAQISINSPARLVGICIPLGDIIQGLLSPRLKNTEEYQKSYEILVKNKAIIIPFYRRLSRYRLHYNTDIYGLCPEQKNSIKEVNSAPEFLTGLCKSYIS